jgi:hypothetical protein
MNYYVDRSPDGRPSLHIWEKVLIAYLRWGVTLPVAAALMLPLSLMAALFAFLSFIFLFLKSVYGYVEAVWIFVFDSVLGRLRYPQLDLFDFYQLIPDFDEKLAWARGPTSPIHADWAWRHEPQFLPREPVDWAKLEMTNYARKCWISGPTVFRGYMKEPKIGESVSLADYCHELEKYRFRAGVEGSVFR